MTSRRVVDLVLRLVKPAKAGHAGTLDPLATGVLIVCVGPATRLIPHIHEHRKIYRGRFRLGCRSNTDDLTGDVEQVPLDRPISQSEVESSLTRFVGRIDQVPPKFSAVHVDGKRAYELARHGKAVELASKTVDVYRIELSDFCFPDIELEIECGSGTYIRSIGRDLGELLGCGALMTSLERTRIGPFSVDDAVSVESLSGETLPNQFLPAIQAIGNLAVYDCNGEELELIKNGRKIRIQRNRFRDSTPDDGEQLAAVGPNGQLVAIVQFSSLESLLAPKQVFVNPD